jgi:hypothetical protein
LAVCDQAEKFTAAASSPVNIWLGLSRSETINLLFSFETSSTECFIFIELIENQSSLKWPTQRLFKPHNIKHPNKDVKLISMQTHPAPLGFVRR